MSQALKAVTAKLGKLAKLTNKQLDGEALVFFAEVLLQRLTQNEAERAIHDWAMLSAKFPAPAELIKHIKGDPITARDEATEVATAMVTTMRRRGYTWATLYRYDFPSLEEAITAECGRVGWLVTQRLGGWRPLCEQFGNDEHATARLRDIAEIAIKADKRGETKLLGAASGTTQATQKLLSAESKQEEHKAAAPNETQATLEADEFFRKMREKLDQPARQSGNTPAIDDEKLPF